MDKEKLKSETFLGIVVDNNDPRKLGRCKIRVFQVFDKFDPTDIPWALPWKDLNGNEFTVPEVGKFVSVVFDQGNKYAPEYIYAQNFNINLEKKLSTLSGEDYTSMRAVLFDHSTQIYRNQSEGLKIDHEYTNINLDPYGNILLNLRDNQSILTLGSRDADEEAVLGSTFMDWMDELVSNLLGSNGPGFIDGTGAPVTPAPKLAETLMKYSQLRERFLSKQVRIPKNKSIIAQSREYINQRGDGDSATQLPGTPAPVSKVYNEVSGQEEAYAPLTATTAGNPASYDPADYALAVSYDVPTVENTGGVQNGRIPAANRTLSLWANGSKTGRWVRSNIARTDAASMRKDAAQAFDALFDLYEKSNFDGKVPLVITDGYRTYEMQVTLKQKYGSFAATPGTSNHGWGIAMDLSGIANPINSLKKSNVARASAYRTPVYKWLFENAWKFGIYSPRSLRDDNGVDEWWHWEFHGNKGQPDALIPRYSEPFTKADIANFRSFGVSLFSKPSNVA